MAESMLLFAVRQDYGEHVFKYLAPPDAGRLEVSFTRELVFVPLGGGEELLRSVARLLHADAVKNGVQLVPLGEGRGGANHVGDGAPMDLFGNIAGTEVEEDDQRGFSAHPGDDGRGG